MRNLSIARWNNRQELLSAGRKILQGLTVLPGSLSGKFAELADKIADIFKTTVQTDFQDGTGGVPQRLTRFFNPKTDQILDWRDSGRFSEKVTEIL